MKMIAAGVGVLFASAIVAACTATTGVAQPWAPPQGNADSGTSVASDLPCDVAAVLEKNCNQCHGSPTKFGAPMSLVSHADLQAEAKQAAGKKVFEAVGLRIHDDVSPMPQAPFPRLSPADTSTLDRWIAAGAPAGTVACNAGPANPSGAPEPLSCKPDQSIRPTSKFAVTADPDLYVCYGFDTDASQKRHVIAGAPRIDNASVVHHVLLYQADEAVSGTPTLCGAGGGKNWRLVTGWAPGGKNFEMPPEAGFAEEAGTTHWAVQIHYNNAQGLPGQLDESGYDLCTTDQLRANDADILATGTFEIDIPPLSTYETTCELSVPAAFGTINVVSSWAHMHRLGRAQYAKRVRGGVETPILDAPAYDFSVGAAANDVKVELAPGDTVRTMCRWQNTGSSSVKFGEATSDEMCFAFLTYYPKIKTPRFTWQVPSIPGFSKCVPKAL